MSQTLAGQVAIVTGASSGIGAATARELARRGAKVVLAARREGELEAVASEIVGAGGQAIAVPTDIADPEQVSRLVACADEVFGRVDVLVNNAGANWTKPLAQTPPHEITRLAKVNLHGAMLATRAVLPEMLERHHGAIISVCSVQGRVAVEPLYAATKFALRGFALALRRQLYKSGVSVSLVLPGNIRTAMTSDMQEQMPGPELIATTIAELVIHPRREVIVPRKYYAVVWLDEFLPWLADLAHRWRHRGETQQTTYHTPAPYRELTQTRASSSVQEE